MPLVVLIIVYFRYVVYVNLATEVNIANDIYFRPFFSLAF